MVSDNAWEEKASSAYQSALLPGLLAYWLIVCMVTLIGSNPCRLKGQRGWATSRRTSRSTRNFFVSNSDYRRLGRQGQMNETEMSLVCSLVLYSRRCGFDVLSDVAVKTNSAVAVGRKHQDSLMVIDEPWDTFSTARSRPRVSLIMNSSRMGLKTCSGNSSIVQYLKYFILLYFNTLLFLIYFITYFIIYVSFTTLALPYVCIFDCPIVCVLCLMFYSLYYF